MGWFSGLTSGLGDAFDSITNDLGGNLSGIEHWLTGSSQSNRQYRYQSALNSQQMAFESAEAQRAFERESAFNAQQSALAAQRQYDYSRQYFDYTAAYNTPAMQMQRLKEAGLNPNLVYGNGAMAMQSGTAPIGGQEAAAHSPSAHGSSGSATGGSGGDIGAALNGIVNAARGLADLKRTVEEGRLTKQKTKALELQNERYETIQAPIKQVIEGSRNRLADAWDELKASGFFPHVYDWMRDKARSFRSYMQRASDSFRRDDAQKIDMRRYIEAGGRDFDYRQ